MTKLKFYGYVMENEWLYNWGIENQCKPTRLLHEELKAEFEMSTITSALQLILDKAGLEGIADFRTLPIDGIHRTCLVFATSEENPHFTCLPREAYTKLQEILDTDHDPDWYVVERKYRRRFLTSPYETCLKQTNATFPNTAIKRMFYGYILEPEWLYEWGVENQCKPNGPFIPPFKTDIERCTILNARLLILEKAGLEGLADFRILPIEGIPAVCLILTTNEKKPLLPRLSLEKYYKLKEILEATEDPDWWVVE